MLEIVGISLYSFDITERIVIYYLENQRLTKKEPMSFAKLPIVGVSLQTIATINSSRRATGEKGLIIQKYLR
jgi:hypothetical protein